MGFWYKLFASGIATILLVPVVGFGALAVALVLLSEFSYFLMNLANEALQAIPSGDE